MGSMIRMADGRSAPAAERRLTGTARGIRTAQAVDLDRFMGRWYVIACIPTPFERGARDATESYRLADDGSIETTFRFRRHARDARIRSVRMRGFVDDRVSNAVWRMRFFGVLHAEYRILDVDADYRRTVIGRSRRDYAWIMSRTPDMAYREFFASVRLLREQGYETGRLRLVPHAPGTGIARTRVIGGARRPGVGAPITPAAE